MTTENKELVKPLEWVSEPPFHVARVTFGHHYAIEVNEDGVLLRGTMVNRAFPSFSAAKAAAQADYEQRIRSALVDAPQPSVVPVFDMLAHLQRQREWSERTFGPGTRAKGVVDHIRKELREIEADPGDLKEWLDVAILALDGAWRAGNSPIQIIEQLVATQARNEGRTWPDWRKMSPDQAIEHDRSKDASPTPPSGHKKCATTFSKLTRAASSKRPK